MKSHILPAKYRIEYKLCATVFNCLFGKAPMYLQELLNWNIPRTFITYYAFDDTYIPRANEDPLLLSTPSDFGNRTRYRFRSFRYCAPKSWNDLSFQLRAYQEKALFKSELKTHFFNRFVSHIDFN